MTSRGVLTGYGGRNAGFSVSETQPRIVEVVTFRRTIRATLVARLAKRTRSRARARAVRRGGRRSTAIAWVFGTSTRTGRSSPRASRGAFARRVSRARFRRDRSSPRIPTARGSEAWICLPPCRTARNRAPAPHPRAPRTMLRRRLRRPRAQLARDAHAPARRFGARVRPQRRVPAGPASARGRQRQLLFRGSARGGARAWRPE